MNNDYYRFDSMDKTTYQGTVLDVIHLLYGTSIRPTPGDRLPPRSASYLAVDISGMVFDCPNRDQQLLGDLSVIFPLCHQCQYFQLAIG